MTSPRPSPSTSRYSATSQSGVETASRERRIIPTAATAVPTIGNGLYRPVFEITFPLPIDAISTPAIIGVNNNPDAVALRPFTICM